jgi:uncharacterized OsmC-like protein
MSAPAKDAGGDHGGFALSLDLLDGYAQQVDFGLPGAAPFVIDEPPPLGADRGPNPSRVLGAALASCLGASLLFCLRKSRIDVHGLRSEVHGTMARTERGRLRIGGIQVTLHVTVPEDQQPRMARCLEIYEDFCVVTASVRPGIPIDVQVVTRAPDGPAAASEPIATDPT